jgi:hypothetical protein
MAPSFPPLQFTSVTIPAIESAAGSVKLNDDPMVTHAFASLTETL